MSEKTQELILELLEAGNAERSSRKKESEVNYFDRQVAENFPQHVSSHNQGEQGDGGKDRSQLNSVVVGRLKAINSEGQPLVNFQENLFPGPIQGRSVVQLREADLEQDVVLMFERGDVKRPIIMGVLKSSGERLQKSQRGEQSPSAPIVKVELDGERVTLSAQKEIVLRCGKASITLTKEGKILIRGAYVSSRSSGPNLIKGGSVQLN